MTGKKKIFAGMGILLGIFAGTHGIAAYQSAFDTARNVVVPGNIETEIEEDFPNPPSIVPDKDTDIVKKIWISNSPAGTNPFSADCYIRVALGYSNSDIGRAVVLKDLDTENWIYNDDGFYYYKNRVREGESTTALCSGFTIEHAKLERQYWNMIDDFQIQVYEESVEAVSFEDYQSAWNYYESDM